MAYKDEFVEVKVDRKDLVKKEVRQAVSKALRKLGFALETLVKEEITSRGLVDTGALRASVYTEWAGGANRKLAVAEANEMQKGVQLAEHVEVDGMEVKVAVGVNYGAAVEHRAKRSPYFAPAIDRLRPKAAGIAAKVIKEELGP